MQPLFAARFLKRDTTPAWLQVLAGFLRVGATSFGGGGATIAAMRRLSLRRGWLDEQAFVDLLVLSRLTPGISIVAQVLLIGRAACGPAGMIAGLVGLMAPAVAITVVLAWLYERISLLPAAKGPLHAIAAVAAGFALAIAIQFLNDVLRRPRFPINAALLVGYFAAACLISRPLIVMGLAIAIAVAVPSLFDDGERPQTNAPVEEEEPGVGS